MTENTSTRLERWLKAEGLEEMDWSLQRLGYRIIGFSGENLIVEGLYNATTTLITLAALRDYIRRNTASRTITY